MTAFRILATLLVALFAVPAQSQVEGQDYQTLRTPQAPSSADKIEILEFFSFRCPHCAAFHPLLSQWEQELPANAVLVRVPVSFGRRDWGLLSRAYYALESTASDLSRLESELFEAIHQQQRPLADLDQLAAWAAEHGVDALKFRAAFTSSEVTAKATRADQLSRDYMIRAVPTLAVDGKYLVLGASFEQMLKNARQLIDKIAAQREAPGS